MKDEKKALAFFVYGTLRQGQPNEHLFGDGVARWDEATLAGAQLVDMGFYPMLLLDEVPADEEVQGELVTVRPEAYEAVLARLDALEGFDSERPADSIYRRVRCEVKLAGGEARMAWVYAGQAEAAAAQPVIVSGNWVAHAAGKLGALEAWWRAGGGVIGKDEGGRMNDEQ